MEQELGPVPAQKLELRDLQSTLHSIREDVSRLSSSIEKIEARVKAVLNAAAIQIEPLSSPESVPLHPKGEVISSLWAPLSAMDGLAPSDLPSGTPSVAPDHGPLTSKIILTTYPGQSGVNPFPLQWGHRDHRVRGPIVVSRAKGTVRRRNAIGAHGGSYSIYYALAVASKNLTLDHRPDYTNTEPAVTLGPFPQWGDPYRIVSMDPFGHLAPWLYSDTIRNENVDIRPTIAVTKAHMNLPEIRQSVRQGHLKVDGKICLNDNGDLAVTKFAVEPVWYLPGVAHRFGIGRFLLSSFSSPPRYLDISYQNRNILSGPRDKRQLSRYHRSYCLYDFQKT